MRWKMWGEERKEGEGSGGKKKEKSEGGCAPFRRRRRRWAAWGTVIRSCLAACLAWQLASTAGPASQRTRKWKWKPPTACRSWRLSSETHYGVGNLLFVYNTNISCNLSCHIISSLKEMSQFEGKKLYSTQMLKFPPQKVRDCKRGIEHQE